MKRFTLILIAFSIFIHLPIATASTSQERIIVLLDISGSMEGPKLDRAKVELVSALRNGASKLDIYTFAESVSKISSLGSDTSDVEESINNITSGSRTSIYDSIVYLIPIAKEARAPIVVISDGQDSESRQDLLSLLTSLNSKEVPVSFLEDFIDARYIENVASIVEASGGKLLTNIPFITNSKSPTISSEDSASELGGSLWPLAFAGFVSMLSLLIGFRVVDTGQSLLRRNRNKKLILDAVGEDSQQVVSKEVVASGRIFRFLKLDDFLADRKTRINLVIITVALFVINYFVIRHLLAALLFTVFLVIVGVRTKIKSIESKKIASFEKELPGALKMLSASLSAGLSFLQAMNAYAENGQEDSAKEFRRALGEIQLGAPVERALESIADRMKSEDLRWAVSAFAIQREVGGSLATILSSTAETIESRFELRREVRTLSAEGRISSYILMVLPIAIFFFLSVTNPDYISVFLSEPIGNFLLVLILISLVSAWLWMKSLVKITL